jgi:hypothetical protein
MDMVHDRMERRASPPALTGETPTSLFFIRANPLKQTSQSTMASPPAKCSCHSLAGTYAGKLPRGAAKLNCCRKFQDVPHRQRRYPLPSKMKRGSSAHLTVRPLTPDLWPAFEDLFGKNGACNGCWCMYWRIGAAYRKLPGAQNKAAFREIVKRGPPPGLVAFDGDVAVGWCQLTPRDALPGLDRVWRLGARGPCSCLVHLVLLRARRLPQTGRHIGIDLSGVKGRQACRCGRRRGLSAGCGQDSQLLVDWIRHYIQTRWLQSRRPPCASPSNHASCSEDNRMMARVPLIARRRPSDHGVRSRRVYGATLSEAPTSRSRAVIHN